MSPDDPRHGTNAGYIAHIFNRVDPCDDCRAAGSAYQRERDKRRYFSPTGSLQIPSLGCQRRMQALVALGWNMKDLDAELGNKPGTLSRWLMCAAPWMHEALAARMVVLYNRLSMIVPQDDTRKARAQALARRRGWVPPLAWDNIDNPNEVPRGTNLCADPNCAGQVQAKGRCLTHYKGFTKAHVNDAGLADRILGGQWRLPCSPAIKTEVCRRWVGAGGSLSELARLTGWAPHRYYTLKGAA